MIANSLLVIQVSQRRTRKGIKGAKHLLQNHLHCEKKQHHQDKKQHVSKAFKKDSISLQLSSSIFFSHTSRRSFRVDCYYYYSMNDRQTRIFIVHDRHVSPSASSFIVKLFFNDLSCLLSIIITRRLTRMKGNTIFLPYQCPANNVTTRPSHLHSSLSSR